MALAGCSQQEGQPSEEEGSEARTGEFTVKQFRVGGERPDEYEAEFIAGSNASEVADELTPEVSYQISGASGAVETQVRHEYSDATIPEDGPLDETVEADTHEGNGGYAQSPSMPDSLVSEILQNPKNLAVRFRATDMESEVTETEEYELNFANSYGEQIITQGFKELDYDGSLSNVSVGEGSISIDYDSPHEIGTEEFNFELGGITGLYSGVIETSRIAYDLNVQIEDDNGEIYKKGIDNDLAEDYLDGDISKDIMENEITFERLKSS
jgi:hypothetical protein